MTSAFSWQNSISLCPASIHTPRPNLPVTPGVSWLPTYAFQYPIMKRTSFWGVSSKSLQPCLIICDPMDCSLPGFSVHGGPQERVLEWVACPPPGALPNPGLKPICLMSPTLARRFFSPSATWEAHIYPAKSKIDSYWEAAMKHRESSPSMDLWWPRGWDRCGEGKTRGRRHMHTHGWSVLLLEETNTALPSNILQFKQQQKNLTNYNDNQLLSQSFNRLGTQE